MVNGHQFVMFQVEGNGFMLNQIRLMVGTSSFTHAPTTVAPFPC